MNRQLSLLISLTIMILFILLYISATYYTKQYDLGLYGLWEAELKFKEEAGLDSMYMLIGPPNGDYNQYINPLGSNIRIRIIARADGKSLINETLKSTISKSLTDLTTIKKYKVDFGTSVRAIPPVVKFVFDPITGYLVIRDDKKVYFKLFKKNEASMFLSMGDEQQPANDDDISPL